MKRNFHRFLAECLRETVDLAKLLIIHWEAVSSCPTTKA